MRKIVLFLSLCCIAIDGFSQVGINTTSPDAQLHIKSSNQATPTNKDGVLIPKIDAFPATNPTAAQQGMMVYLTTISAGKAPGFYYWDNTGTPQWKGIGGTTGWDITGNSGTNSSVNFLGTIDSVDVVFRRNNTISGKIGGTSTSFGFESISDLSTGNNNTAMGSQSMFSNTTGSENVAVGKETLYTNNSGSLNTAVGFRALPNGNASNNTAIGGNALVNNYSGESNVAVGVESLFTNFDGINNTALGRDALHQNSDGENNTGLGYNAGNLITSGSNNTAVGANADVPSPSGSNQLSIANVIYGTGTNLTLTSKIGINEPAPNAKLQISASSQANPNNTDGVIIPKVDTFPIINPTAAQNGMMVFLTAPAAQSGFYYWDNPTTSWKGIGANTGWGLTGNSGTDPAFNFIGTTDDVDVVFHRDILEAGRIGMNDTSFGRGSLRFNTGTRNTAFGNSALSGFITGFNTGNDNTAIGYQALMTNTFGSSNVALGSKALQDNKAASNNIAIGDNSLYKQNFTNSSTPYNTGNIALGYGSLYNTNSTSSINGLNNIGIGTYALANNGIGISNIALGNFALGSFGTSGGSMSGSGNIAIGVASIKSLTTGSSNLSMGSSSLGYNTVGSDNISIGTDALFYSTAQSNGLAIGTRAMQNYAIFGSVGTNDNVAIGYEALKGATCCPIYNQNTAVGYQSLTTNSANNNTANGFQSLFSNATGTANTAFGNQALRTNISGSNNIAIGYQAGYSETGSNKLYIENSSSATPLIYGEFDTDLIRINGKTEGIYTQLTANGDGQSSIFGYRTRDSQNDGTGYGRTTTNRAVGGYNLWGDLYTFGVTGHCFNDYTRTGGVLGAEVSGAYWSSLGYRNSGFVPYGVYATAVLATGAGRFSQPQKNFSIGGGFYGGMIGSWSKGNIIGQVSSGTMFASYNSGDEYTVGKQIELVDTGSQKTAAYTVTSTESIVYKKGKTTLTNGTARVDFDKNYLALLGEIPVVTITPMGQCNGLFIESIDQNGFTIKELNNGTSNVAISWIAVGDRIDAKQNKLPKAVLEKDFDNNINEVMFNENNKTETAKAIWFDGTNIQFGPLPSEFIEKNTAKKE